jgi:hypothetical protein
MKKDIVPCQQSMELKELGFDEECFATYEFDKIHINEFKNDCSYELCLKTEVFPAPTFSQAFRWFREKHGPFLLSDYGKFPHITIIQNLMFQNPNITHEEAELDCLKMLIKTIKNK